MSAGKFTLSRYQATYGAGTQIHPIRVQPETIEAQFPDSANLAPTGAINNPISAIISRGAKQRGLRPRSVRLKLEAGTTPPAGYDPAATTRIPVLTKTVFDAVNPTDLITYLGASWVVVGKDDEEAD